MKDVQVRVTAQNVGPSLSMAPISLSLSSLQWISQRGLKSPFFAEHFSPFLLSLGACLMGVHGGAGREEWGWTFSLSPSQIIFLKEKSALLKTNFGVSHKLIFYPFITMILTQLLVSLKGELLPPTLNFIHNLDLDTFKLLVGEGKILH